VAALTATGISSSPTAAAAATAERHKRTEQITLSTLHRFLPGLLSLPTT